MSRRRKLGAWLLTLGALLAVPAAGETPSGALRVFFSSANPSGDWSGDIDLGAGTVSAVVEAQSTAGFGVLYEVRLNDRFGVESGIYFADFDFEIQAVGLSTDFGSALAIPVTLGANFHPFSGDRVDFYIGPLIHYTLWGNLDTPAGAASVDGDFGIGGVAGVDLSIGKSGWTFGAGLRYLAVSAGDPTVDIDVDPIFAEVGVGYRF